MLTVGWEVDADVHGQEVEHLALRPELGCEGLGRDLAPVSYTHLTLPTTPYV